MILPAFGAAWLWGLRVGGVISFLFASYNIGLIFWANSVWGPIEDAAIIWASNLIVFLVSLLIGYMRDLNHRWREELARRIAFEADLQEVQAQLEAQIAKQTAQSKETEEAYRILVEQSLQGIVIFQGGKIVFANPKVAEIVGYSIEEILSFDEPYKIFTPEEDYERVTQYATDRLAGKEAPNHYEGLVRRKDGEIRWLEVFASTIEYRGKPAIQTAVMDITERKQAQEALAASEEKFFRAFNSSPFSMNITASNGVIIDLNKAFERITGYSREEALGHPISELNLWLDSERQAKLRRILAQKGAVQDYEFHFRKKSGQQGIALISCETLFMDGEKCILSCVYDITQRKQAEALLKASEEKFNKAFHFTPAPMAINRYSDGIYLDANKAFIEMVGYTTEETIGHSVIEMDFWDGEEERKDIARKIYHQGFFQDYKFRFKRSSGQFGIGILSAVLIDINGQACVLSAVHNITEQVKTEEMLKSYATELERSNRELQNFAYVSSHDLQEPLRKIQAFGSRLESKYADQLDQRGQDYLQRMQNAAARMQLLIQDLLTFSRVTNNSNPFEQVDLNKIVQDVLVDLDLILEETKGEIIVSDLPQLEADSTQMRQLFQNLISNALKFSKPNIPPIVRIDANENQNHNTVQITVSDNGIGFDEQYAERIFTVFQRLHNTEQYAGTGIGLAICRRIAERHNGNIIPQSKPGKGATFIITLPISQKDN